MAMRAALVFRTPVTTPRLLIPLASLAAACALSSCVPVTRYEEARSSSEVQTEALRRNQAELEAARARITRLEQALKARSSELEQREESLAEKELDWQVLSKERQDVELRAEQLRAELSRAGEHLQTYSADKTRLEGELSAARKQVEALDPALIALSHQIRSALGQPVSASSEVLVREGTIVLRIPADDLFDAAEPRARLGVLLDRASQLLRSEPRLLARVRAAGIDGSRPSLDARKRHTSLATALSERGVSERIVLEPLSDSELGSPAHYEIALSVAPVRGSVAPGGNAGDGEPLLLAPTSHASIP